MLHIYIKIPDTLVEGLESDFKSGALPQNILWIDLLRPRPDEIIFIPSHLNLRFLSEEERGEIELSAKYWEDSASITINAHFSMKSLKLDGEKNLNLHTEIITFATAKNILFTARYSDFSTFNEIQTRILASPKNFEGGFDIIDKVSEVHVEKDADLLEWTNKEARRLRSSILEKKNGGGYDELLKDISSLQDLNMRIHDSFFDKRRAATSLLKSDKIGKDIKQNLTIVLEDLNSLVEFSVSQFNTLDNTQTILIGQISIERDRTVKLFTAATMAVMPPTLVGTIYGVNFKLMPELEMHYAHPTVLGVMVISIIAPVYAFKKRG